MIYDEGSMKIVKLMYIFYEMVKSFETYPTTSEKQQEVMVAFRKIVECNKLQ
jgi:hypothetical protein